MRPADHINMHAFEDFAPTVLFAAAIVAVVTAGSSAAAWAVVLALVLAVAYLAVVNPTMARQVDDNADRGRFWPRPTSS